MQSKMGFLSVLVGVALTVTSGFGVQENGEIFYKTYCFEKGKLYVAQSAQGILFAGMKNRDSQNSKNCEIPSSKGLEGGFNKNSNSKDSSGALKNGHLKCGEEIFEVKNGEIEGEVCDSFSLKSQKITYRHSENSPSEISASVLCSKNLEIQNLLELMYHKEFGCANVREAFLPSLEESMQEYLKNTGGMDAEAYLKKFPIEEIIEDRLYYFDEEILVFEKMSYLYTGGAHGNHGKWGVVVSKKEGIVPLNERIDLNNLELKKLLWEEYQKYLSSTDEAVQDYISFENFKVSDAILLDYDGVVFVYQPYEIMPYVYGIIELRLPLEAVGRFGNFGDLALGYLPK